jgi:2-methylfumaryl-CoA hydratase
VYPGTTLNAVSDVIGLKENSNGQTGIVYVRTQGFDDSENRVLSYARWVMVRKRDPNSAPVEAHLPALPECVPAEELGPFSHLDFWAFDTKASGSAFYWDDYEPDEKIDHVDGVTVEEAEHAMATRLYQNTARVHFNQHVEGQGRFRRRLIYGGHAISMARALSFNGLGNAVHIAAINGGRHVAPLFAGDTVYAWSQVLAKAELAGRKDCGALRLRLVAAKNIPCTDYPDRNAQGDYTENVILDFDYWALLPRRC